MTATLTQSTTDTAAPGTFEVWGLATSGKWANLERNLSDLDTAVAGARAWAGAVDDLLTIVRSAGGTVWSGSTEIAVGRFVRIENPFDAVYEGVVQEIHADGVVVLDNVTAWYCAEVGVLVTQKFCKIF
jgi:hypothetical protein